METLAYRDVETRDFRWRITSSLLYKSEVYGREVELKMMRIRLLNNVDQDQFDVDQDGISVHVIYGMGGLGKTTVAQLIYNDEDIKSGFDLRIWICVSDDFSIRRLIKAIIRSIEGMSTHLEELDTLQNHLDEKLMGKKFLLVLDDVWNECSLKWESLKAGFRCGANGSSVIVTTRSVKAAELMKTTPVFNLGSLSDDDSWSLFKQRAFRTGKSEDYPELEQIGKEIVKKCVGVPLAINALGNLMRFKNGEKEWLSVKQSKMWELEDEASNILHSLRLSYTHLKPHLRECFAFCCIFPKGSVMIKEELVQLWIANGFVPPQGEMNLHDLGCLIYNELTWRSFLQNVEDDTCKMHDLMHDLAMSIMRYECHAIGSASDMQAMPKTVRHMLAYRRPSAAIVQPKDCSLRSLIIKGGGDLKFSVEQKYLRALELTYKVPTKMPVEKYKQLRYLSFFNSDIKTLSESLCNLLNLQTLKLAYCYLLEMLPERMKRLKNLIYLDIKQCNKLTHMPVGLGELSCLRSLSIFIVGKDPGCCIDELKWMDLEGDLCIKELNNVKSFDDARNANMVMKKLKTLTLSWSERSPHENDEKVLDGLQPNSKLKILEIQNYHGARFSFWLMDSLLPNLTEISLEDCKRCDCLLPLGKLLFLKELFVCRMDALKSIDNIFYGDGENPFPSLEKLAFCQMASLEEWTTLDGRESFPQLSSLIINNCPKLVELPMVHSLKFLHIKDSNIQLLVSVMHFTSVTDLSLQGFDELAFLPDGLLQNQVKLQSLSMSFKSLKSLSDHLDNLSALQSLELNSCSDVKGFPKGLKDLNSLKRLLIDDCESLVTLSENGFRDLSSLYSLEVHDLKNLTSLSDGVRYLTSLQGLLIKRCPKLNSLPQSIQHLSALQYLTIDSCQGLTSLPNEIEHLTSLSVLQIFCCLNLVSLPQGLKNLTALKKLFILDCPHLQKRCNRERGEDWSVIAHIPSIEIMSNAERLEKSFGKQRSKGSLLTRLMKRLTF